MMVPHGALHMVDNPTLGPTTFPKRHVFLDTDNLIQWGLGIYQRFPKPEIVPVYGLECGPHGSWNARMAAGYGTILYEDGKYRQWGCSMPSIGALEDVLDIWLTSYAESDDGIHWVKPDLGIVGQKRWPGNNLIDINGCLLSVVRPLPGTGWKYVALAIQTAPPYPGVYGPENGQSTASEADLGFNESGTYLFGSDDGLHWRKITKNPIVRHGDVAWLHVDPVRQRYLLYHKLGTIHGLIARRSMIVMESRDLIHWEGYHGYRQWHEAMHSDDYDDLFAVQQGFRTGEYNGHAFHQIDTLYLALQAYFMIGLPLRQIAGQQPAGHMVLRLAYSHDGMIWRYPRGRPLFVENAPPGEFGASYLSSISNVLDIGDETRHYYTAFLRNHIYGMTPDFRQDPNIPREAHDGLSNVFMARMKRDRYGSLASTYKDTVDVEIGPRQGTEFAINAITRGSGRIRVALAEQSQPLHLEPRKGDSLPGFSFDDCIPIVGDEVRAPVRFRNKSVAEIPKGMALVLRLELDGAEVFAYEWNDNEIGR